MRMILWFASIGLTGTVLMVLAWPYPVRRRVLGTYLFLLACSWWMLWTARVSTMAKPWEGPWRGQVVDAETNKPLEGVVVFACWDKSYEFPLPLSGGYYTMQEIVTGPDGQFVIASCPFCATWFPLSIIEGPKFTIVKPGYGYWEFQGYTKEVTEAISRGQYVDRDSWIDKRKKVFNQGEDVTIALPPLKTADERQRFYSLSTGCGEIPPTRMPHLTEASDAIDAVHQTGKF